MTEEVVEKKQDEDWMQKKWRPAMGWMYMICCLCDFCLFPILFTIVQFWETQAANDAFRQWVPITLQGGGLFHVAMGAVLGISAYGRTQEKLGGAANNVSTPTLTTVTPVVPTQAAPVVSAPPVVTATPQTPSPAPVVVGFNGKLAPPPAEQPLI